MEWKWGVRISEGLLSLWGAIVYVELCMLVMQPIIFHGPKEFILSGREYFERNWVSWDTIRLGDAPPWMFVLEKSQVNYCRWKSHRLIIIWFHCASISRKWKLNNIPDCFPLGPAELVPSTDIILLSIFSWSCHLRESYPPMSPVLLIVFFLKKQDWWYQLGTLPSKCGD